MKHKRKGGNEEHWRQGGTRNARKGKRTNGYTHTYVTTHEQCAWSSTSNKLPVRSMLSHKGGRRSAGAGGLNRWGGGTWKIRVLCAPNERPNLWMHRTTSEDQSRVCNPQTCATWITSLSNAADKIEAHGPHIFLICASLTENLRRETSRKSWRRW